MENLNIKKYFEIGNGTVPIILSCPHGGYKKPIDIPDKIKGVQTADKNKYLISKQIIKVLNDLYEVKPFFILSKIHRCKIDFNRPPRAFSAFNHSSIEAKNIHQYYHDTIEKFYVNCIETFNRCLFIDLHGFTKPNKDLEDYPDIIFGNLFGNTLKINKITNTNKIPYYWGFSELIKELSKNNIKFDDGLAMRDFNLSYSGGYITHKFYKKEKSNAFQLEVSSYIREDIKLIKRFINAFVTAIYKCLKYN